MKNKTWKIKWHETKDESKNFFIAFLLMLYIIIISIINPIHVLSLIIVFVLVMGFKRPEIKYYKLQELTKKGYKRIK